MRQKQSSGKKQNKINHINYPKIGKSKYKAIPRYIVIIERFQKRSNAMQMSLNI